VRAFHQDDAHLFMTSDQIQDEIIGILKLSERLYGTFGLGFELELSTRPEKSIGTDEQWATATSGLQSALDIYGSEYRLNEGDGAFYGPKIDLHIKDALGRTWQCGTIQLDMSMPERFDLTFVDSDNQRRRPIMIHRTIFGSIERFLGILIEHFAGKFPLWMAPVQAVFLPINDALIADAQKIETEFRKAGLRTEIDRRTESLNRKIRDAQLAKIPLILTIGEKEKESGTLAVRTLDGAVRYGVPLEELLQKLQAHVKARRLSLEDLTLT